MRAKKSRKRVQIIDTITRAAASPKILTVASPASLKENSVRMAIHGGLLNGVEDIYASLSPTVSERRNQSKAAESVIIEAGGGTVINNLQLFGTQHRPDFEVKVDGLKIAIEVKVGDSGQQIREGIGQAIVYSTKYDFVVYLFVDNSPNKKVLSSVYGLQEQHLAEQLWSEFNVRFHVV